MIAHDDPVARPPAASRRRWQLLAVYGLALLLTVATFFLRQTLNVSFGNERPLLILFMFPVIVSALLGGAGPGLIATLTATAGTAYFLIFPAGGFASLNVRDLTQWGLLMTNGVLVSFLGESLHRSRQRETARRQQLAAIQDHLQQVEARFQATFELAAVGIALVAPDGRWLQVNRKLCEIVGYSEAELLARTVRDIIYKDDLQAEPDWMQRMLAGDIKTFSLEERYLRKDGGPIWINLFAALVRKSDATPDYFIFVIKDIHHSKQAEAVLKARESSLKEAQHLAGIGNWAWDIGTDEHTWSDEVYRLYGRDPALPAAVYPEVRAYFTPESWTGLAAAVETSLAQGTPYECDAEVMRADGMCRWIVARGEAERDGDGHIVNLHGTVQDITARKQAEEEISQLNADLERRVAERTAELTAANNELDSFSYAVSHDLRGPLRAMSGFSQALKEDCGDQLQGLAQMYLEQIDLASRKMSDLIDGLLTLSRSTRGQLRHDTVDLSALSARLLAELARNDPGRRVAVEVEDGLQAYGDARMIESMMYNLLENAWKYTEHAAAPSIRVYAEEQEGERRFCVADNGAGFDMAHANRLFEPFQRLHRQEEFSGIGIGLATVQRIVHRHGGVIEASGEPGQGAVFRFTLSDMPADSTGDEEA